MSNRSGGLLELVARGKKDLYFTSNPSRSFINSVYIRAAPFTREIYSTKPRNIPEWGRSVDFDIEQRGDLVNEFYLHIQLPTWIPNNLINVNRNGIITDVSGVTFGYCNNIGFQMIDKVQVFQDQVLIHEIYGEFLDWRLRQKYSLGTSYVLAADVGSRDESALAIGRAATVPTLRVPIPIFGWQHIYDPGLPLVAMKSQRFRIRVHIRRLEDVIVASDARLSPAPWDGKSLRVQAVRNGPIDTTQKTLSKDALKYIGMELESTQIYVPSDVQTVLRSQTIRLPFLTMQHQKITIMDNQLTAAAAIGGVFNLPLRLDFIGSVSRIMFGIRSEANEKAGARTNLRAPDGSSFITTARLNIAGLDRIKQFPAAVFREVSSYWKNTRSALDLADPNLPQETYTLTFGGYDNFRPEGTLSFTRAVTPILNLTLNSIPFDTRNISRKAFCLVYAESWNVWEISGGKGRLLFDDS